MEYDVVAQEHGYCGHICPTDGPAYGYVCTRENEHEAPLHQVVQLVGPEDVIGHINAAWLDDGTVTLFDPVSPACPLTLAGHGLSPQNVAEIDQRVAVVSGVVDSMVADFRSLSSKHDPAVAAFYFNLQLFNGYSQAPSEEEALKKLSEALAVAVKKLAEATGV